MCGRFTYVYSWPELAALYPLTVPAGAPALPPRYNVAPGQDIPALRMGRDGGGDGLVLSMLRWGLVPGWAKSAEIGARMINARAETISDKPAFRAAVRARRCVIPVSGFYEWQRQKSGPKQPFLISAAAGGIVSFAGIWERWSAPAEQVVESCAIITVAANGDVAPIHHRMPAILAPEAVTAWLTGDDYLALLRPAPEGLLNARPVSRHVNNPAFDDAACTAPPESGAISRGPDASKPVPAAPRQASFPFFEAD